MNNNDNDNDNSFNNGFKSPFDKDVLEEKNVLSEKNFIREAPNPSAFPAWLWLFLFTIFIALIWGGTNWLQNLVINQEHDKPFMQVTNREFSVFLWQFPSFLRANVKQKTGYLTGFQYMNKETLDLNAAEKWVVAPPELLFLYHTWSRLLAADFIARPIPVKEFIEFVNQVEEWKPQYWKQAPEAYIQWFKTLQFHLNDNLQLLPNTTLPLVVRQAFQGWKNYFKEGPAINKIEPTFKQVKEFLEGHPNYARNNWRNIQEIAGQQIAGENYLKALLSETLSVDEKFPIDQITSFLKVALFNAEQAKKGL